MKNYLPLRTRFSSNMTAGKVSESTQAGRGLARRSRYGGKGAGLVGSVPAGETERDGAYVQTIQNDDAQIGFLKHYERFNPQRVQPRLEL